MAQLNLAITDTEGQGHGTAPTTTDLSFTATYKHTENVTYFHTHYKNKPVCRMSQLVSNLWHILYEHVQINKQNTYRQIR